MRNSTGLVLQGGGARGAFECGAILRLYTRPGFGIHAVAGASIGAINAACLAGGRTREELGLRSGNGTADHQPADGTTPWALDELWRRLKSYEMPSLPHAAYEWLQTAGNRFCFPRLDYLNLPTWTSCYSTEPMRHLLTELVDFDKLNDSPVKVTLVAVDIQSGELAEFTNWRRGQRLTIDHIMASASLPPGFPMTEIDHHQYWDGGLFDNTPLESVIDALVEPDTRASAPAGEQEQRSDLDVYLMQLMPSAGGIPRNLVQVPDRMVQIIFANKSREDADRVRQINDCVTLVRDLVKVLPADAAAQFDQDPRYKAISQYRVVNLVTVPMRPGGISSGAGDFSAGTIDARIAEGQDAADEAMRRQGVTDERGSVISVALEVAASR